MQVSTIQTLIWHLDGKFYASEAQFHLLAGVASSTIQWHHSFLEIVVRVLNLEVVKIEFRQER